MSLINDALKRASEAQSQAQTRPRGPKGIDDLPAPMTPVAARERPAWLPVVGIGLLILALLGGAGYFFAQWWKERKAWQPYVETPEDPPTNAVAHVKPPPEVKPTPMVAKPPVVTPPAVTNPPAKTNVEVAVLPPVKPTPTNPPPALATNPVVVVQATNPPPIKPVVTNPVPVVTPPPIPPPATNPAVAIVTNQPPVPSAATNSTPSVVAPPKRTNDVALVEFPELKLQGISRGKKKAVAIVNGKTLQLGDRIEGAFLLKIEQESVTFEKGSVKKELFLLR